MICKGYRCPASDRARDPETEKAAVVANRRKRIKVPKTRVVRVLVRHQMGTDPKAASGARFLSRVGEHKDLSFSSGIFAKPTGVCRWIPQQLVRIIGKSAAAFMLF